MRRLLHHAISVPLLASFGAVAAGGCADNDSSLFIYGVVQTEQPECTATASASATFLARGSLDVALGSKYEDFVVVGNQMAPRGDKDNLRAETSHIILKGAEVRLEESDGTPVDEFTVPGAGAALVNTSREPGFGLFFATMIPPRVASSYRDSLPVGGRTTVVASIRVFGDTLGGRELESAELVFPIEICNQCFILFDNLVELTNGDIVCDTTGDPTVDRPCRDGQGPTSCVDCTGVAACARP